MASRISGRMAMPGAALLLALAMGGCASTIADLPMVGTPAGVPARPAEAGAYLPVHDLPTNREDTAMAPAEQAKIEKELIAARDRQAVMTPAKTTGK
jgi:hypothetical protein